MHGFTGLNSLPLLGEKSVCTVSGYCSAAVALKLQNFVNCLQNCYQKKETQVIGTIYLYRLVYCKSVFLCNLVS